MRIVDVVIAGGGLAGATAGAMLGRAGIPSVVIDPHPIYPPDFRCEKLGGSQVALLGKTGLQDAILPLTTPDKKIWYARFGRLVDKAPHDHVGIIYDKLVNAMRAAVKPPAEFVHAKITAIDASDDRQVVTLNSGERISARLVVLATGLGTNIRDSLGIERVVLSPDHTLSMGFDVVPAGRPKFDFPALMYFPERRTDQMAYITFFPVGRTMRANLFTYRSLRDPWVKQFKAAPAETLIAALPYLKRITGEFEIQGKVDIRPMDVYEVRGHRRSGVALVGDAFSTSCPAVGMGVGKVLNDVERLCNVHIPNWLKTPGMGVEKVAEYYDDPVKVAADAYSKNKAFFMKSLYTDPGFAWAARCWLRFGAYWGRGILRQLRGERSIAAPPLEPALHG